MKRRRRRKRERRKKRSVLKKKAVNQVQKTLKIKENTVINKQFRFNSFTFCFSLSNVSFSDCNKETCTKRIETDRRQAGVGARQKKK